MIRLSTEGAATAYLASDKGTAIPPISYEDLPEALANGKGRIRPGPQQKAQVASFLRNALGTGDGGNQDTHDRVVFVRSASFRYWGWDWLQDKHIRADRLVLPGIEIDDDEEIPRSLSPQDCPGLRIIRVRDRGSRDEIARGFGASYKPGADDPKGKARVSGPFRFSERIFYSVNPRSDQMQTALGVTKLDPDITQNYTSRPPAPCRWRFTRRSCSRMMTPPPSRRSQATCAGCICTPSKQLGFQHCCTCANWQTSTSSKSQLRFLPKGPAAFQAQSEGHAPLNRAVSYSRRYQMLSSRHGQGTLTASASNQDPLAN